MTNATQRFIFRRIHIAFGLPIVGYVYSPFEALPDIATPTRYVFMPVLLLSGVWMWKGHWVKKLINKSSV